MQQNWECVRRLAQNRNEKVNFFIYDFLLQVCGLDIKSRLLTDQFCSLGVQNWECVVKYWECFVRNWAFVIKNWESVLINQESAVTVACFLSSRTDLLCRIAAGEALCLVTHLVSYRGSKNCTQIKTKLHLQLGPSWEYKPFTTILVFYSTRCEDWTAMEDTSQQSFQG